MMFSCLCAYCFVVWCFNLLLLFCLWFAGCVCVVCGLLVCLVWVDFALWLLCFY